MPLPQADPGQPAEVATVESLAITDLQLCRRVLGFGSFEAIDALACKAGQTVIVYCEMAGVGSTQEDSLFRARLASEVEVLAADGDAPVWRRTLGTTDDTCTRRRHDFYVNYRLTLPDSLQPGNYRLRLIQKDLIADRTTSATLNFSIQP